MKDRSDDKLLQLRAKALARAAEQVDEQIDAVEIVTFVLGGERYAVELEHVREIAPLGEFTPVPGAPAFLFGLCNLRGEILAIFDLRRHFNLPMKGMTDRTCIVVLGHDKAEMGLLAEATEEVVDLPRREIQTQAGGQLSNTLGVTRDALIVLDGAALLADEQLIIDTNR